MVTTMPLYHWQETSRKATATAEASLRLKEAELAASKLKVSVADRLRMQLAEVQAHAGGSMMAEKLTQPRPFSCVVGG